MKFKDNYPVIALCLAIFMNGILMFSEAAGDGTLIPILMQLLLSELGFLISAGGVYYSIKSMSSGFTVKAAALAFACAALGIMLAYKGYVIWQSLGLSGHS